MKRQFQLLNLIRRLQTEKDAFLHSSHALLESSLSLEQSKLITEIFKEHQESLSQILNIAKKLRGED